MHEFCGWKVKSNIFVKGTHLSSIILYVREDFALTHDRKDLLIKEKLGRIRKLLYSCYL